MGWTAGHRKYNDDGWTGKLVEAFLTGGRPLERLMPGLHDEISLALRGMLGMDTERWTEFEVLETMKELVVRASGRYIVGVPLCKIEFLINVNSSSGRVISSCIRQKLMPGVSRPRQDVYAPQY